MAHDFVCHSKSGNFTIVSNRHLYDRALSLKAMGLLTWMISRPPDWDYSIRGMCACVKDGKDSIKTALAELKAAGYVRVEECRADNGTFRYVYHYYDEPIAADLPLETPDQDRSGKSVTDAASQNASWEPEPVIRSGSSGVGNAASANNRVTKNELIILPPYPSPDSKVDGSGGDGSAKGGQDGQANVKTTEATFDDDTERHIRALMNRSINRGASEDAVKHAYSVALSRGYSNQIIADAYERYVVRYRAEHPDTPRFAMRLDNWLTRGDGLLFDAPPKRAKKLTSRQKRADQRQTDPDDEIAAIWPEFAELRKQLVFLHVGLVRAEIQKNGDKAETCKSEIAIVKERMDAMRKKYADQQSTSKPLSK